MDSSDRFAGDGPALTRRGFLKTTAAALAAAIPAVAVGQTDPKSEARALLREWQAADELARANLEDDDCYLPRFEVERKLAELIFRLKGRSEAPDEGILSIVVDDRLIWVGECSPGKAFVEPVGNVMVL